MKITSNLIQQFKNYLEQRSEQTGEVFDFDAASSIYRYSSEFEEFIEERYGSNDDSIFNTGFDINKLEHVSFEDGQFTPNSYYNSEDAEYFAQLLNDLMEDSEFKNSFDSDGDGKISQDEYNIMIAAMNSDDNKKLSMDEFLKTLIDIQNGDFSLEEFEVPEMPEGFTSVPSPGGGTGGGGIFNPQNTVQKTIDNMTADELTVELDKATKTTEASKNDLNQIIDGTSPEIVQKQEAVDTAYNNFQSDLEKIDRELSVDLDTKKVEVEGIKENINTADVAINEQTFIYTTAKGAYDNAVQQILGLNSQITALETELSATSSSVMEPGAGSDNSVAIGEKLNAAKAELAIQEKRRDDNKDAYLAAEKEKNNQIKLKEGYVVQLAEAESQLAEFEAQVAELAGAKNSEGTPVNPELAASYEQYETLKTDLETFKTEARTKAQKAFDENLQYQNQVQAKLNEKQKAATEKDYSVTGLKLDYTLNGVDFDVVGIAGFDNLDDFMRQVQISGLTNTGEYGTMQCQNYSCAMIDLILGRANPELLAAFMAGDASGVDLAGYMARNKAYNNREYHAARPTDGTSYMQVLASELQQGRPCMVAIPRETTGTHYGICVGIRKGADYNNLQPSDFLIIDSYDAKPEIGGVTNSYSANKDVWVLTEGYRYENSGPKYVRYQDGQALV